jgi:hypothetical protein
MKEVVCIVDSKSFETVIPGQRVPRILPQKNEIYRVTNEIRLFGGRLFYFLYGFEPDQVFIASAFADITGLQNDITDALKAPEPKRLNLDPFYI